MLSDLLYRMSSIGTLFISSALGFIMDPWSDNMLEALLFVLKFVMA